MTRLGTLTFAATLVIGTSGAWALGQNTIVDGAAYGSACAGLNIGSTGHAGDALNGGASSASVNCQFAPSPGTAGQTINATATNSGTQNGHNYSNSGSVTAAPQFIKVQASNAGSTAQSFPGGMSNGGWNENFLLTGGGANGTQGVWIMPIHVSGTLSANGLGSLGRFNVEAYRNQTFIQSYGPAINGAAYTQYQALNPGDCFIGPCLPGHNGNTLFGWDYETVYWTVNDRGPSDSSTIKTINVDQDIYFAVAFTWGTAFDMGFYAQADAGEGASGGSPNPDNTTDILFQNTVSWGGPGYVLNWNGSSLDPTHITEFVIDASGGSGANYMQAFSEAVPEPASLALLGFGLLGLWTMRRRA